MKNINIWSSWSIYNFPTNIFYDVEGNITLALGFHCKTEEGKRQYSLIYWIKVSTPESISNGVELAISEAKLLLLRDFPGSAVLN